jgi:hypothetical protein
MWRWAQKEEWPCQLLALGKMLLLCIFQMIRKPEYSSFLIVFVVYYSFCSYSFFRLGCLFSLPIKLMIPIPDQHSGYFPKFNPIYPTKPISSNISPLRPFIDNLGPSPLPSGPHWPLLTLFLNVLNVSDFSWCLLHLAFHRTSFVFIFLCSSDYILFVFLFSVALSTTFYSY